MAMNHIKLVSAGGLTFRKTFTPKQCETNTTSSPPHQQKVLFNRLCDLFGKDPSDVKQVFEPADETDTPARAGADVLGYNYNEEMRNNTKEDEEEDDHQLEMKDRLMKEIKEKISERRKKILQQRKELFNEQDSLEMTNDQILVLQDVTDLWKAVPALADPDNANSSYEEDEGLSGGRGSGIWDPDAAFSEVERVLESLSTEDGAEELVGRFRMLHRRQLDAEVDDKRSDDSGMSSSADTSAGSSSPPASEVVTKPVRKSKQQVDGLLPSNRQQRCSNNIEVYTVTRDSPAVLDLEDAPHHLDLSSEENDHNNQPRSGSRMLTRSAGEIFGSFRSNLSAGANTFSQHVVRPLAETVEEASYNLSRATEPLVQHLQLLSTRLQVRYMHAAQHKQWLPHFALMREASDWIEGIPKSQNGFEELRLHVKEGGDVCKELSAILQERSELESSYAKGLAKLASKLLKTTGDELQGPHGTVTAGWAAVALEMESEAELHKSLSVSISEELVKPLKTVVESQYRVRKAVESGVDKTGRVLAEWRSAQAKAKKQCYLAARDNEKSQDQIYTLTNNRTGGGQQSQKVLTEKELAKLESKCKKTQESVRKAEGEYYTCCTRAERSRMEWESTTQRGGRCFHALEQERLGHMKDLLAKYYTCLRDYGPKIIQAVERLSPSVESASVEADLQRVSALRESAPSFAEQLLPDFYAEHMSNVMNRERRKESLERCLHWVRSDVERESRGKRGVENLARALQDTPHFGGEESQLEVQEKLLHLRSMLAFLEMSRVKLHNAASELEPTRFRKVEHPLFKYLEVHKDKQGMMQSVLKLPHWIDNDDIELPGVPDRGTGDGGNQPHPDSDFDEFSSQGEQDGSEDGECSSHSVIHCSVSTAGSTTIPVTAASVSEASPTSTVAPSVGKCRALYSYAANMYDELSIQPGDLINIHDKQADGWWLGELHGIVGIFPATYVEEV